MRQNKKEALCATYTGVAGIARMAAVPSIFCMVVYKRGYRLTDEFYHHVPARNPVPPVNKERSQYPCFWALTIIPNNGTLP